MSTERWRTEFNAHPLWSQVERATTFLDSREPEGEDEQDWADRLRVVLATVNARRDLPLPMLVPRSVMNALNDHVGTIVTQLTNWAQGSGSQFLRDGALNPVDNVLQLLAQLPVPPKESELRAQAAALGELVSAYRERADAALAQLKSEVETLREAVAERETELTAVQQQTAVEQTQLKSQLTELAAAIQSERTSLASLSTQQTEAFSRAETERATQFQANTKELQDQGAKLLQQVRESADGEAAKVKVAAEKLLEQLRSYEAEAKNVLNATGTTATATEYGTYADRERRAGWWLRVLAVLFSLGAVAAAIVFIVESHGNKLSWQAVVLRFGATLAVLGAGAFCAAESRAHFKQERKFKRIQLDLAALGPFIVNLEAGEQKELRKAAAQRLFTNVVDEEPKSDSNGSLTASDVTAIAKLAKELQS